MTSHLPPAGPPPDPHGNPLPALIRRIARRPITADGAVAAIAAGVTIAVLSTASACSGAAAVPGDEGTTGARASVAGARAGDSAGITTRTSAPHRNGGDAPSAATAGGRGRPRTGPGTPVAATTPAAPDRTGRGPAAPSRSPAHGTRMATSRSSINTGPTSRADPDTGATTTASTATTASAATIHTSGGSHGRAAPTPATTRPVADWSRGLRPPRLTPRPDDFTDPRTVATQYLSVWCYLPVDGPANLNIAHVAPWVTAAGWDDDKSRAITTVTWTEIQDAGITTVCGPVTAELNTSAPSTDRRKFVTLRAARYQLRGGQVVDSDSINTQRRVLRADDGRWLVDIQVLAG